MHSQLKKTALLSLFVAIAGTTSFLGTHSTYAQSSGTSGTKQPTGQMKSMDKMSPKSPAASPSGGKTVNGTPSQGYYWQLTSSGKLMCRSQKSSKIQTSKSCKDAGAKLPPGAKAPV